MLRVSRRWRALLPGAVMVAVPVIWQTASAAERVVVPDGPRSWTVMIAPGAPATSPTMPATEHDGVTVTAYRSDQDGPVVPPPVEPQAAEDGTVEKTGPIAVPPTFVDAASYEAVYRSIPFRRSEYLANPSYRHEATLELLFGQLRPTVIQKAQPGRTAPSLADVRPRPVSFPWVYDPYFGQVPTFFRNYAPTTFPLFY